MNNTASAPEILISARHLRKSYSIGASQLEVLHDVSFDFVRGAWTALLGASGSGKTTLLNLLGALEAPDAGELLYENVSYRDFIGSSRKSAHFRNRKIGFIFQNYQLLPEFSILENVMLPGMLQNAMSHRAMRTRSAHLLELVGLTSRIHHRPGELSGGEQQRAAIARALFNDPELLLADEPTGNLDSHTGNEIMNLLHNLKSADGKARTILMITHNESLAQMADHVAVLADGMLTPL